MRHSRVMPGLGRTIPALPVTDVATAVTHVRDRLGFAPLHVDDDGVRETDFGTREFATIDEDGNLVEFFCWL